MYVTQPQALGLGHAVLRAKELVGNEPFAVVLSDDVIPPIGARIDAECFFPLQRELGAQCARNTQCATGFCDPISDSCQPLPETLPGEGGTTGG